MLLLLAEHSEAANHRHLCSVAAIKRPKKKERERKALASGHRIRKAKTKESECEQKTLGRRLIDTITTGHTHDMHTQCRQLICK